MLNNFISWALNFIKGCGDLWTWLITEIEITQDLTIAPIYLICGGAIIIGIVRAIL